MRIILVLLLLLTARAQSQNWQWAVSGGAGTGNAQYCTPNHRGGVYVLADVTNVLTGPYSAICGNQATNVLVNHDQFGNIQWQLGLSNVRGKVLSSDSLGNVYVAGISHTLNICSAGGGTITANQSGSSDAFLAKYDLLGNVLWAKVWGLSNETEDAVALTVNKLGHITVGGTTSYSVGAVPQNSFFLKQFDKLGNTRWFLSGSAGSGITNIDCDSQNNIYICGGYTDTLHLGNYMLTSPSPALFVAKLDSLGQVVWAKSMYNYLAGYARSLKVQNSNILLCGSHPANCNIGTSFAAQQGMFIAKLDTTGNNLWVKSWPKLRAWDLVTDSSGNIFIAGTFRSNMTFSTSTANVPLTTQKLQDLFVAKLSSSGIAQWAATTSGGAGGENCAQRMCLVGDDIYITGLFVENTTFGTNNLNAPSNSSGASDAFIAKLKQPIPLITFVHEKLNYQTFLLYPNPTKDFVYFQSLSESCSIKLLDVYGQTLHSESNITSAEIDLRAYASGVYLIIIQVGNSMITYKVIKQF